MIETALAAVLAVALAPAQSLPSAAAVAERLVAAMGGKAAWDAIPGLAFRFVVTQDGKEVASRFHLWDKWKGRHRLETTTADGKKVVVLHSLLDRDDPSALVAVDGLLTTGDDRAGWIEKAHALWVNDVYWLAMPWKLFDPGVRLGLGGEETIGGKTYDVLELSFDDGVGLTSGDRYWAFVERGGDSLLARWEYVLEGQEPPPTRWTWEGWSKVGGVMLSSKKVQTGGPREIRFEELEALPADSNSLFSAGLGGA